MRFANAARRVTVGGWRRARSRSLRPGACGPGRRCSGSGLATCCSSTTRSAASTASFARTTGSGTGSSQRYQPRPRSPRPPERLPAVRLVEEARPRLRAASSRRTTIVSSCCPSTASRRRRKTPTYGGTVSPSAAGTAGSRSPARSSTSPRARRERRSTGSGRTPELQDVHKNTANWVRFSFPTERLFALNAFSMGAWATGTNTGIRSGEGLHGQVDRPRHREDRRHDRTLRARLRLPRHRLSAVPEARRRRARRTRLRLAGDARLRRRGRRGHDGGDARLPGETPAQGPLRLRGLGRPVRNRRRERPLGLGAEAAASRGPKCARHCSGRARSASRWCSSTTRSTTTSRSTADGEAVITATNLSILSPKLRYNVGRRGGDDEPSRAGPPPRLRRRARFDERAAAARVGLAVSLPLREARQHDLLHGREHLPDRRRVRPLPRRGRRRADRELLPPARGERRSRVEAGSARAAAGGRGTARRGTRADRRPAALRPRRASALGQPRLRRSAPRGSDFGRAARPAARTRHGAVRGRAAGRSRTST